VVLGVLDDGVVELPQALAIRQNEITVETARTRICVLDLTLITPINVASPRLHTHRFHPTPALRPRPGTASSQRSGHSPAMHPVMDGWCQR